MRIDPIVLGHNQFIGVDHLSQDRARNRTERFGDIQKILDVVKSFYDLGGTGMMLSTHPKAMTIMEAIGSEAELSRNFNLYPLIPYAQGYVRKANEMGVVGMLKDALEPIAKGFFKYSFNAYRRGDAAL
jgi:hypothetical protein